MLLIITATISSIGHIGFLVAFDLFTNDRSYFTHIPWSYKHEMSSIIELLEVVLGIIFKIADNRIAYIVYFSILLLLFVLKTYIFCSTSYVNSGAGSIDLTSICGIATISLVKLINTIAKKDIINLYVVIIMLIFTEPFMDFIYENYSAKIISTSDLNIYKNPSLLKIYIERIFCLTRLKKGIYVIREKKVSPSNRWASAKSYTILQQIGVPLPRIHRMC